MIYRKWTQSSTQMGQVIFEVHHSLFMIMLKIAWNWKYSYFWALNLIPIYYFQGSCWHSGSCFSKLFNTETRVLLDFQYG